MKGTILGFWYFGIGWYWMVMDGIESSSMVMNIFEIITNCFKLIVNGIILQINHESIN